MAFWKAAGPYLTDLPIYRSWQKKRQDGRAVFRVLCPRGFSHGDAAADRTASRLPLHGAFRPSLTPAPCLGRNASERVARRWPRWERDSHHAVRLCSLRDHTRWCADVAGSVLPGPRRWQSHADTPRAGARGVVEQPLAGHKHCCSHGKQGALHGMPIPCSVARPRRRLSGRGLFGTLPAPTGQ